MGSKEVTQQSPDWAEWSRQQGDKRAAAERDGLCTNCLTRPATENWIGDGGALAWTHGLGTRWCMRCVLTAQIRHAESCAESLPQLKAQLEALTDAD